MSPMSSRVISDAVDGGEASRYVRFASKMDANPVHRPVSRSAGGSKPRLCTSALRGKRPSANQITIRRFVPIGDITQPGKHRRYSITSSARVRNNSEMVNPSVFAVLRFTISSNLVGN